MKVWEIVKIGREMLNALQKSCMSMTDCEYLPLYEEYVRLVDEGAKRSMTVVYLAEKYRVSERRVWYLVKKFGGECKIGAVGK